MPEIKIMNVQETNEMYDRSKEAASNGDFREALRLNHLIYESDYNKLRVWMQMKRQYLETKVEIVMKVGEEGYAHLISDADATIKRLSDGLESLLEIGQVLTEAKWR